MSASSTECPGCQFLRTWNALYRAIWEAGDRCADLQERAAALDDGFTGVGDPGAMARGMALLEDHLLAARDHLQAVRRAVPCSDPADASRN